MVPHCCVSVSSMIVYKKGTQPFGRQTTCTVALCNRTLTCVVTCNFLVKKKKSIDNIFQNGHLIQEDLEKFSSSHRLQLIQRSGRNQSSRPLLVHCHRWLCPFLIYSPWLGRAAGRGLQPTCFILRLCLEQFRKHLVPVEAALGDGETCFLRGDTETEGETRHRGMRRGSVIEYFVAAVTRRHLIINRSLLWPLLTKRWGDHSPDWGGRDQHGQAARYLQ